jgi:hypothetical protein
MNEFMLEKRLKEEAPDLHRRMTDSVVVLQEMLNAFLTWFPDFTDHSTLHSMDVLYYCNELLGEQVSLLTIPECYALVMACYLHDVGMGMPRDSFQDFTQKLGMEDYWRKHPDASPESVVRAFHNELSGRFIRKYQSLFDIPSQEYLFAIVQISRGHRKTDLFDKAEYPDIPTPDGVIRTAFLSALLRLADEIDVGADRNPELLFDTSNLTKQVDIDAFGTHESIPLVEVCEEAIVLYTKPKEPRFVPLIAELAGKIQETLDYCRDVADKRSDLRITQNRVEIQELQ